ncbi:hypothetical protein NECAME_03453 [Necator americanus]|uniref:Uncharacterized protein n=1 Tax=Necator americanus TaxID=51031 RepID=W2T5P9_NECAM|nr:hypothetical protein NECAME_03453 [Necator americanus]ETN76521.1 hypothetical protein NECAME_03453 [Necator americanus]
MTRKQMKKSEIKRWPIFRVLRPNKDDPRRLHFSGNWREQNNSEGKPPLKLFPKKSHRTTYSLSDNNFDEDYVRINETFFQDVNAKNREIRRQPTGRPLSMDGKSETFTSGISNEDDDNDQPFAVTESLIKSLESADNEVTMPIRTEKAGFLSEIFKKRDHAYTFIVRHVLTTPSDQYAKHPVNTFIESTDGTYLSSTVRPTTTSTFDNELTSVPSVPAHKIQDSIFSGIEKILP